MREQGRVPREDITKEEILSSKSDLKSDLSKSEDLPFY